MLSSLISPTPQSRFRTFFPAFLIQGCPLPSELQNHGFSGHRSVSLESQPTGTLLFPCLSELTSLQHGHLPSYCSAVSLLSRVSSWWGRTEPDSQHSVIWGRGDCLAYNRCFKLYVSMLLDSCWLSVCPLPVLYSPVPMGADPAFKLSLTRPHSHPPLLSYTEPNSVLPPLTPLVTATS